MNNSKNHPNAVLVAAALLSALLLSPLPALADPVFVSFTATQGTILDMVRLAWSVQEPQHIASYSIVRGEWTDDGPWSSIIADSLTTNVYEDMVWDARKYDYKIIAKDIWGHETDSDIVQGWALSVPVPAIENFSATQGTLAGQVRLAWNVTDPESVASYRVIRYLEQGEVMGYEILADSLASAGYVDTTAEEGVKYRYQIVATDIWGRESQSEFAYGWAEELPELAGSVGFTASRGEYDDRVWLDWTPVDPGSVASYDIVRLLDHGGVVGFDILTNGMTSVGYLDTTVTPNVSYRYQLRVHDKWGRMWVSPFVHGWAFPRPDNDDFADARAISSKSGSDASTNNCASSQVSEPYPAGVATAGRTVWWAYTAPSDGIVRFDTAGSCELRHWGEEGEWTEDGILTAMAVYTGKAVTVLDEVCSATPGEGTWCTAAFEAASGTVYRVQVSGYGNYDFDEELQAWSEDWGRICLNWGYTHYRVTLDPNGGTISTDAVMVPVGQKLGEALRSFPVPEREGYRFVDWKFENNASVSANADYAIAQSHTLKAEWAWISSNDNFEDALPLDVPGQACGSSEMLNANATLQEGEPLLAAYPDATHTIWWSWTAPADGTATFSTTNSVDVHGGQIDTVLGVFTGSSLDSLALVAKGDDGVGDSGFIDDIGTFWSFAEFEAKKGTTYYICVGVNDKYDRQAVEGTICLNWNLETDGLSHGDYALLPPGSSGPDIPLALGDMADPSVEDLVGDSVEAYNDFAVWANGKGAGDVRASTHAAASYLLGTTLLLQNTPQVTIGLLAIVHARTNGTPDDGAKAVSPKAPETPATLTLDVTVSDGGEPVEVTAEKVAALVEATSDPCDWESPETKLDPHAVALVSGSTTLVTIVATPGDGTVPQAFLRIAP